MDNSFSSLINSATSVLVVLPTKPYFDQVAAGLALYLSIREKKETSIYCPSQMTVGFNRLIGVNKVLTEVGNKNLIIKFVDYEATNIEKVGYDIDGGEFKLTITPKTGFTAPNKDQVVTDYSGVSADLVILVGGANDAHFPIIATPELSGVKIAHIGTRVLDSTHEIMSFAKPASSASELTATLIKENELTLDTEVATDLVMGIEDGSSNFASSEVTPQTFETFAYLLRNGGQRTPKIKLSPASFPPGAIPGKVISQEDQKQFAAKTVAEPPQQARPPVVDVEGTSETEQEINPPSDWLQPKIFKNSPTVNNQNQPQTPSENKG